ncbi:hypothetical protein F8S13_25265 [Chloroflexia bacterium SDU3-3]|nr:hypothetical protein F8S13_25265 [Chloroflexia bacterium SDU3-3]
MRGQLQVKLAAIVTSLVVVLGSAQSSLAAPQPAPDAATNAPLGISSTLLGQLRGQAKGDVQVSIKPSTGVASMVRVPAGGDLVPNVRSRNTATKAAGFFSSYAKLFGIADANAELLPIEMVQEQYGGSHITYRQVYHGVPVFGGMLIAHFDASGALTSVNGVVSPASELDVTPRLSAAQAGAAAVRQVLSDPPTDITGQPAKVQPSDLWPSAADLYVYRTGLVRSAPGSNQLTYEVTVTNGGSIRERVYVHANAGKVLNRYTDIESDMHRVLYEEDTDHQVWEEGQAFPGALNQDQQNIINASGNAYYFFLNSFGRDSYDAQGASMRIVNNDPRILCPNANWNGTTTNYCNGVSADDVVAHEWGHAFTEYTHGLVYQWQSGALNEAYSDIWGETVDLINGAGSDTPGGVRANDACSGYSLLLTPVLQILSPSALAGICAAGTASFGPSLTYAGVSGTAVVGLDGASNTGCVALTNAAAVSGKIVLLNDSTACNAVTKVRAAQTAGAKGAIIVSTGETANNLNGTSSVVTIPSIRIALSNGNLIKNAIAQGQTVDVSLRLYTSKTVEASYRWLVGEDATAFGSALRDMWNPSCLGDPSRVSDANYYCGTADSGGVHTNSAVPNHGYALLVDGGSYNGQTVVGLGLVKAAHIYWQAQTAYQTPVTEFADHADALEQSCQDLIGQPLKDLSTAPGGSGISAEVIAASDCEQVAKMAAAIDLRAVPTQCNYQPLLNQNTPALCSDATKIYQPIYEEHFEQGLGGWTQTNSGTYAGWPGYNWSTASTLPKGRAGSAIYARGKDEGNCDTGAGDISGVQMLTSPAITIPSGASPKLAFTHYVANEMQVDGGNVRISINGGAYTLIGNAAFTFNPYNATLITALNENTNPLAGQRAFTGTDGGHPWGSWGQSQIDLTKANVKAGDTIRLRFDFGTDGCGGLDGWYVDDLLVYTCADNVAPVAVDDAYTLDQDTTLTVDAPGVLANDTDANTADTKAATLATDVAHGTVSLQSDGSLVYIPAAGFFGSDSFTYTVTDSKGAVSAAATVTLTVNEAVATATPVTTTPVTTTPVTTTPVTTTPVTTTPVTTTPVTTTPVTTTPVTTTPVTTTPVTTTPVTTTPVTTTPVTTTPVTTTPVTTTPTVTTTPAPGPNSSIYLPLITR